MNYIRSLQIAPKARAMQAFIIYCAKVTCTYGNHSRGARHGGPARAQGTMASYNRSTSAPAVESSAGEASIDGFPPVLVLYHPSMEMLARNIVDATIARTKKLSLSEASCINACSY